MHKKNCETFTLYSLDLALVLVLVLVIVSGGLAVFGKRGAVLLPQTQLKNGSVLSSENEEGNEEKDKEEAEPTEAPEPTEVPEPTHQQESTLETKTTETVVNPDGTTSQIERETEDGKTKIKIKTFGSAGNTIQEEVELDEKEGKQKRQTKTFDKLGNKLTELHLKTEDNQDLALKIQSSKDGVSKATYDLKSQELRVQVGDQNKSLNEKNILKIKVMGNDLQLTRAGAQALTHFPLTVNEETGQISVTTPLGEVTLKAMPDVVVQKAQSAAQLDRIERVELEENPITGLQYRVAGVKTEKFLGIFSLNTPTALTYDAVTGIFLDTQQSTFNRLLGFFSF